MKKAFYYLILLALVTFSATIAIAQPDPNDNPGLIFEQDAYNSQLQVPYNFGSKSDELPLKASVKEWAPKVGNQGRIGSCVGWSVGYGNLTIMYSKLKGWTDINERTREAFSALYIYNNIKRGNCNTGSTLEDAGNFTKNSGDCKSTDFDYPVDDCNKNADNTIRTKALEYKIKGYYSVFGTDDSGKKKVYKVKKNLSKGYPVVIGMMLRKNFFYPNGQYWKPNEGNTQPAGGHAMVVVGYDDHKQAFELMNSWGTAWGSEGYIWVKYEDFQQYVLGAYRYIIDEEVEPEPQPKPDPIDPKPDPKPVVNTVKYRGAFQFRVPVFNEDETITFKEIKPVRDNDYVYKLTEKDWEVGDMYDLMVKETQKGRAVYVFSIDGEGSNIHWPRSARYNSKFSSWNLGSGETPIIPYNDVEIVIPGVDEDDEQKVLTKRIEGDDNIFILYAYEEIKDFQQRVEKVKNAKGDIKTRFQAGFGDLVVPTGDLDYSKNKMKFVGTS